MITVRKIKLLLIALIAVFGNNLSAQTSIDETNIKPFLIKHSYFKDTNPTHQEAADEIYTFFTEILSNNYTNEEKEVLRTKAFTLLYNNSSDMLEDSFDLYRMIKRRSMCFIIIALLSKEDRGRTFLRDAYTCLLNERRNYEKEKAIVNLLILYMDIKEEERIRRKPPKRTDLSKEALLLKDKVNDEVFLKDYESVLKEIENLYQ